MAKNVWLSVERGRASRHVLDEETLALLRAKLSEVSRPEKPSRLASRTEPHSLYLTSTGEPLYPHDVQGLAAVFAVGSAEGFSSSDEWDSRPRFVHAKRVHTESIWSNPSQFSCECTADAERFKARAFAATRRSGHLAGKETEVIAEARPQTGAQAQNKDKNKDKNTTGPKHMRNGHAWKYLLAAAVAVSLLFLVRAASDFLHGGGGAHENGHSAEPGGDAPQALPASDVPMGTPPAEEKGVVGASALSPEPLNAFAAVVKAKLERDPRAYAHALLRLDASRHAFAPNTLPSRAFIAAMAMHTTPDDELDSKPTWRAFLERLGAERSHGIGVVGYEASRIRKDLNRFVSSAQQKGAMGAKEMGLWALWGIENSRQALPKKEIEQATNAALESLARIERVFPTVAENERVFRNLLSAEAIFTALQLTWFVESKTAAEKKALSQKLEALRSFVDAVPRPERDTLAFLLEERRAALHARPPSWKARAAKRVDAMLKAQEDAKALCDVHENVVMPDFLLQTLRIVRVTGLSPKPVAPWQRCFLAPKAFHAVERATFDGVPETAVLAYVPRTGPLALNLKAHTRVFSVDPITRLPSSGVGPEMGWHLTAFLSRLVPNKAPFTSAALTDACQKKRLDRSVCTQLVFALAPDAETRMQALEREQEDASPDELAHLAFQVALDVYTKRNTVAGRRRPDVGTFKALGFARYFGPSYPEFSALDWHMKSSD